MPVATGRGRVTTGRKVRLPTRPLPKTTLPATMPNSPVPPPFGYTPFKPEASPPPGQYDPNLDAQDRAAGRGLGDFQADTRRDTTRRDNDYRLAKGDPALGEAGGGLEGQRARGLADSMRNYLILGQRHEAAMRNQGLDEGGTAAASQARRTVNQTREDTRLNQGVDRSLGTLALNYQRSTDDSVEAEKRAVREREFFGLDTGAAKWYQAGQAGYAAPIAPPSEHTGAAGPYKSIKVNGRTVFTTPAGQVFDKPPGTPGAKPVSSATMKSWAQDKKPKIKERRRG